MEGLVDLVIEEPEWRTALPGLEQAAEAAATAALAGAGLDPDRWQLSLLACDDARIAGLNGQFRGREQPTNVLSWPAFPLAPAHPGALPPAPPQPPGPGRGHLGDLALSLRTTRAEAEAAGLALNSHVIHLILHGTLHLLGYDHGTEEDAARMEGLETRLLGGMGLSDPYGVMEDDAARTAS